MEGGIVIGIVAVLLSLGGPILAFYLFLHFANKNKAKKMDTLVKLIEHGTEVDPELLKMLGEPSGPKADLRKGVVWLAIGIPLTVALFFVNGGEEWEVGLFGFIPVFIGIAYLIVMKYGHDESKTG